MLRVIRRLTAASPVTIRSTFLGAHAFPAEYKKDPEKYVAIVNLELEQSSAEEASLDEGVSMEEKIEEDSGDRHE